MTVLAANSVEAAAALSVTNWALPKGPALREVLRAPLNQAEKAKANAPVQPAIIALVAEDVDDGTICRLRQTSVAIWRVLHGAKAQGVVALAALASVERGSVQDMRKNCFAWLVERIWSVQGHKRRETGQTWLQNEATSPVQSRGQQERRLPAGALLAVQI